MAAVLFGYYTTNVAIIPRCISAVNGLYFLKPTEGVAIMPTTRQAMIRLKMSPELRNQISGKLRLRGMTMQGFFVGLMALLNEDEALLELLESKRHEFENARAGS
jgi:hypothetical protein